MSDSFDSSSEVMKVDDVKGLVFGWASVAVRKDGSEVEDAQGDIIDVEELEEAAYEFVLKFRESDDMHTKEVTGHLVESIVFTQEKLDKMGIPEGTIPLGWWVGFKIDDKEQIKKLKSRKRLMFSIGGDAIREKIKVDGS